MQRVSVVEDLMREHGILQRILCIYKNIACRFQSGAYYDSIDIFPMAWEATYIVKEFIEEYHQQVEEDYIFPALKGHQQFGELIETLVAQHESAKCVTNEMLAILKTGQRNSNTMKQLSCLMTEFTQMYEPHMAREDTVCYLVFQQIIPVESFVEVVEVVAEIREQKFGENGFAKLVGQVSQIEKKLNIYNLNQFTARRGYMIKARQMEKETMQKLLKDGGCILYTVHGEANAGEDLPQFSFDDCNTQRNLSQKGRMEAIAYGGNLAALKIPVQYPIQVSPFCRNKEAASLAFGKNNIEVDPFWYDVYRLNDKMSPKEQEAIMEKMKSKLEVLPPDGKNKVVIAHSLPVGVGFGPLDDMETVIIRPHGEGKGYEVVDKVPLMDIVNANMETK